MRRVYIDIATTGMDVDARVIEMAFIEEIDEKRTGNNFNRLINPEGKPMSESAIDVTGYSDDFLKQFPQFYEIADAALAFIKDAELVCWDVNYDLSILNLELHNLGKPEIRKPCYAIAPDIRTIIKKNHPHMNTMRHFLYLHFDVKVNGDVRSWVQANCLGMAILHQKIK